jgi:periplasmic glucans biosynthesis protein
MDRRSVLIGAGMALFAAGTRVAGSARAHAAPIIDVRTRFSSDYVERRAQQLSQRPFVKPSAGLDSLFQQLSYDRYREIQFRSDKSIWRGEGLDYELQLRPLGWLYKVPVEVWVVSDGDAGRLKSDGDLFKLGPLFEGLDAAVPNGFSGFRIHGPINRPDIADEYVVFQGASYFRAVGRGQTYGLSGRGLAINTARPGGEEFPIFRSFWIEKPEIRSRAITVHALLDSESTTGAYKFRIAPGEATIMDVEATLYPRRTLTHVGLGPLTSMYLHGPGHHRINDDFRPAVHDSNGLAIRNGHGERIWRPLTNPRTLQTSAFMDTSPQGFGLCQRARSFHAYEDLEADYELRPSVWIEPRGDWGRGAVELVEIPADAEVHDNIVAYWKPAYPPQPGRPYRFAYRMSWTDEIPVAWSGARAAATRVGRGGRYGSQLFVVDFTGPDVRHRPLPVAVVTANPGTIANVVVQPNPNIDGVRVSFELLPNGTQLCELRLALKRGTRQISETWLYRWTKA